MHAIDESFFVEVDQQPKTKILKHRGTEVTDENRNPTSAALDPFRRFSSAAGCMAAAEGRAALLDSLRCRLILSSAESGVLQRQSPRY